MGKWESKNAGKWESGKVEKRKSGKVGKWESRKVGKRESGKVKKRDTQSENGDHNAPFLFLELQAVVLSVKCKMRVQTVKLRD